MKQKHCRTVLCSTIAMLSLTSLAGDAPLCGLSPTRNMASLEIGLPTIVNPGKPAEGTGNIDLRTTKNVKWVAGPGGISYGLPMVGGGRVYVGTNNDNSRDPGRTGDCGILVCLDQATGDLLWQLVVRRLAAGDVVDFGGVGLCSAPTIDLLPDGADRLDFGETISVPPTAANAAMFVVGGSNLYALEKK